jgi:hypothetical protein
MCSSQHVIPPKFLTEIKKKKQRMTNHSLTPELVLQQTASHFMRLEDEMKQTRSMVDEWSFKQDEEVQLIVREHRNLTQGYKKTMQQLSEQYERLERQVKETEQRVKEEHRQELMMKNQVKEAQDKEMNLPNRAIELEQRLNHCKQLNKQHETNIELSLQKYKLDCEKLVFNIQLFEKYLGMKIERFNDQSNWVRILFKYIDSNDPEKIYSFSIRVEKEKYLVKDCLPEVDYWKILQQLNQTNDFRKFVIQMRVLFYQYAKEMQ